MTSPGPACRPQSERRQRENTALPAIVGPHDDDDVLHRDHDDERPGDQREHPVNHLRRDGAANTVEALPDGIERRGSDVAIDDAERAQDQSLVGFRVGLFFAMQGNLRHTFTRHSCNMEAAGLLWAAARSIADP